MNVIWSSAIQGPQTLYLSRQLRFDDRFAPQYQALFGLDDRRALSILEIGCGPGALAGALHRWYPKASVTGIDRDSAFIAFAQAHEAGVTFLEGDATALPFADSAFDVTISHTVSEHVAPSGFYGEQLRVLKPGGICLVLSSRKSIQATAKALPTSEDETRFWEKVAAHDDTLTRYAVCQYPMDEAELPAAMEHYGFTDVRTGYVAVALTPDQPDLPAETARRILEADLQAELESVAAVRQRLPELFTTQKISAMTRIVREKHALRLAQYERGQKLWDTSVSVIMVVRGQRPDPSA